MVVNISCINMWLSNAGLFFGCLGDTFSDGNNLMSSLLCPGIMPSNKIAVSLA